MRTTKRKAARKACLKTKLLPIVIPAIGITGSFWVKTFMEIREMAGLTRHAPKTPWTPAPMVNNAGAVDWSSRPLDSSEITDFIRCVLKHDGAGAKQISSHSCKATTLSWLAKFGVTREERDVLGRHVSSIEGAGPCTQETCFLLHSDLLTGYCQ